MPEDNAAAPKGDNDAPAGAGPGSGGLIDSLPPDPETTLSPDPGAVAPSIDTPATPPPTSTDAGSVASNWKSGLSEDIKGSPLLKKFEDTPDGLNQAFSSHANLEQLLGHDKVPIPKDMEDIEGWNRFSKAMGIPDKAEGYGLPDANLPDSMKGITLDKDQFANVMHAHKVHPSAVTGIWKEYQRINVEEYGKAMDAHKASLNETVNRLRGDWGDAYDSNVELGQTVINKFSEDQEGNDYLTSILTQDPRGIKFLAKIGDQFAENKIGEFAMKRFSLSPDEAQVEIDSMTKDLNGPYMNTQGSHTDAEHQAAIARVDSLRASILRSKG